ncbi:hypothetical protein E2986_11697 [Frieseomelitta varia]|uniref:Uncharacterized protein n=1 Tax=Frieseomelitta varia TaxID=561572 RepID=A0A833VVU1_9HYME|nr:hypothetical protein E2986_11697 [Frieseomelitta varia]
MSESLDNDPTLIAGGMGQAKGQRLTDQPTNPTDDNFRSLKIDSPTTARAINHAIRPPDYAEVPTSRLRAGVAIIMLGFDGETGGNGQHIRLLRKTRDPTSVVLSLFIRCCIMNDNTTKSSFQLKVLRSSQKINDNNKQ